MCNGYILLGAGIFEEISPLCWIKKLGREFWSEILVGEIRWIIFLHEGFNHSVFSNNCEYTIVK